MSGRLYYVWDGEDSIRPTEDIHKWAKCRSMNFRVAHDEVDGQKVSTVFLGIDHGYDGGPPVLFETMIFGGPLDQEMCRYCFPSDAREGHKRVVEKLQNLTSIKEITDDSE